MTNQDLSAGRRFVNALGQRDFEAANASLDTCVRFRAITPGREWAATSNKEAVAVLKTWFGDREQLVPTESSVETVVDRIQLRYRFRVKDETGWNVCEQQAYCIEENGVITDISIVCSGFRPVES